MLQVERIGSELTRLIDSLVSLKSNTGVIDTSHHLYQSPLPTNLELSSSVRDPQLSNPADLEVALSK